MPEFTEVYFGARYANMWDTYFAKHLKGTAKSNINLVVDSQATRTRVVNAIAWSKAVTKLKREEPDEEQENQLWENVEYNVMANHDKVW